MNLVILLVYLSRGFPGTGSSEEKVPLLGVGAAGSEVTEQGHSHQSPREASLFPEESMLNHCTLLGRWVGLVGRRQKRGYFIPISHKGCSWYSVLPGQTLWG